MKIRELMEHYSFAKADVERVWSEINHVCFDGTLDRPTFVIEDDLNHLYPGLAEGKDTLGHCDEDPDDGAIVILLSRKIESAKELIAVLAHEMVHQSLAQEFGYAAMLKIGHGPLFSQHAVSIRLYHNTPLLDREFGG